MIQLTPTTTDDIPELTAWIAADEYHKGTDPSFWLTGNGLFAGKASDQTGTLAYVRCDDEKFGYRLHTQFSPQPPKSRVVKAALEFINTVSEMAKQNGKQYLITNSTSPSLIKFLARLGFQGMDNHDYKLVV
jgi:hypothetical protein